MARHISRGLLRLGGAVPCGAAVRRDDRVAFGCLQAVQTRLYRRHLPDRNLSPHCAGGSTRLIILSAPVLSARRPVALLPPQTRGIIISKVIDAFRNAEITSVEGFSKFIIESAPVGSIRHFYELMEATTGLPWAANIILCSATLQLILNTPANIYMVKWATRKENQIADLIAIKSTVMRSPNSENLAMFRRKHVEFTQLYGCQTWKFLATISYQMVHLTITSFGVRSLFLQPNTDLTSAVTPWGSLLSQADPLFILPVVNFLLSLLLVEVAAWKKSNSEEGLKMTHRRANLPFKREPLLLLNVRRGVNLPMLLIYGIVPTGLNIHWLVMMLSSVNIQILLTHRRTRRALGIPPAYFETDHPYRDLLHHLKNDVRIFSK